MQRTKPHLSLTQSIAVGFALLILLGTLLLMLPAASRDGASIPPLSALFTATSATCVTGLVVYDTYSQFTLFGQIVILTLIQIGGLGFMTVAIFISMILGKRIGLKERTLLSESINSPQLGGVVRLVKRALIGTAIFELSGAALLSIRFVPRFGWGEGLYFGLFHAISSFCNAGFDLMGKVEPFSSLTAFRGDVLVNLVVCFLITVGGIGFVVWNDVAVNRHHVSRYRLHTRIVLLVTLLLTGAGALLFFILERDHAFAGMSFGERALAALFQSVTPRTAGYNTVEMADLSEGGAFLTLLYMLVGASPGSTGGGIKTTTLMVLALSVTAYARNNEDLNIFRRRIPPAVVRKAYCSATSYLLLLLTGAFLLLLAQSFPLRDALFECFSAMGTVGLSTGITRSLNGFSRLVIILLMYAGRVGTLSVALAVAERKHPANLRNPEEKITIG